LGHIVSGCIARVTDEAVQSHHYRSRLCETPPDAQPDDRSKDVFVHISAVERTGLTTLNENQKVWFELERGANGKISAANLKAL